MRDWTNSADPLVLLKEKLPFENFRPELKAIWRTPRTASPMSPTMGRGADSSRCLELYNLSDDQIEYQIRDRLSFMRFLDLGVEDRVPDAKTVWLYREKLVEAGMMKTLFDKFDAYLRNNGYLAMGGQIVDASIVPVPRQHNQRNENDKIKAGEIPQDWAEKPDKTRQKDVDARWTKKHGMSHYGYKNHINVDRRHKFIRTYEVSDASVHDSRALNDLIDPTNTSSDFWADSAYRSQKIESELEERGYRSHIHHKGRRGKPLGERQKKANKTRSKVRVRVEHVFGFQQASMGGKRLRSIGIDRAKARIGMMNLVYNMKRFIAFECDVAAPG